jgi:hypothetical protein
MTLRRLYILSVRTLVVSASSGTLVDTVNSDQWVKDHPHVILIGGVTIVTAALVPILLPVILNGAGFTAGGVVAGSWADGVHASIGNVAAGSLFAMAQSIGAGGALPLSVWPAADGEARGEWNSQAHEDHRARVSGASSCSGRHNGGTVKEGHDRGRTWAGYLSVLRELAAAWRAREV